MREQFPIIDIHETAIIEYPLRPLQGMVKSQMDPEDKTVKMLGNVHVGAYSIIGEGVTLGNNVIVDVFCNVERGVEIGEGTIVVHRATIGGFSRIGKNCVIGGLIGEGTIVEDNCRVFGTVVHKQDDPSLSWDHRSEPEPSVVIHNNSFVGFETFMAGDIEIGPHAYVCAGAVVTKTVGPGMIAFGNNQMIHFTKWKGKLKDSEFFKDCEV